MINVDDKEIDDEIKQLKALKYFRWAKEKVNVVGDLFLFIPPFNPNGNEFLSILELDFIKSFDYKTNTEDVVWLGERSLKSYYKQTIWALLILHSYFTLKQFKNLGYIKAKNLIKKDIKHTYGINIGDKITKEVAKRVELDMKHKLKCIHKTNN